MTLRCYYISETVQDRARPKSRSLESQTAGLQSLWLASRLKPWLWTTDGSQPWLKSTNKKINRSKLAQSRQSISYVKCNTKNSTDAVRELAIEK